jgi:hypothetical protein
LISDQSGYNDHAYYVKLRTLYAYNAKGDNYVTPPLSGILCTCKGGGLYREVYKNAIPEMWRSPLIIVILIFLIDTFSLVF